MMLWAGEGGVSAGRGWGQGAEYQAGGLGLGWGGPHGRSACRDRPGPTGPSSTSTPAPRILSCAKLHGHVGQGTPSMERRMSYRRWARWEHRKSLSLSEPPPSLDAGSKAQARTCPFKSLPPAPTTPAPSRPLGKPAARASQDTDAFHLGLPTQRISLPRPRRSDGASRSAARGQRPRPRAW